MSSGMYQCISAGASVLGAIWKMKVRPSSCRVSPSFSMRRVGSSRPDVPREVASPSPAPTCPRGEGGSREPYMYWARRLMALPASTFSATAASMKPPGAMIRTLPAATSFSSTTPCTPP